MTGRPAEGHKSNRWRLKKHNKAEVLLMLSCIKFTGEQVRFFVGLVGGRTVPGGLIGVLN